MLGIGSSRSELQFAVASSVGCEWKVRGMGKLIHSMLTSLDGYTEDENGRFGWGAPEDKEVHSYINALGSSIRTYLYGRKMYDTMVYWEKAHTIWQKPSRNTTPIALGSW